MEVHARTCTGTAKAINQNKNKKNKNNNAPTTRPTYLFQLVLAGIVQVPLLVGGLGVSPAEVVSKDGRPIGQVLPRVPIAHFPVRLAHFEGPARLEASHQDQRIPPIPHPNHPLAHLDATGGLAVRVFEFELWKQALPRSAWCDNNRGIRHCCFTSLLCGENGQAKSGIHGRLRHDDVDNVIQKPVRKPPSWPNGVHNGRWRRGDGGRPSQTQRLAALVAHFFSFFDFVKAPTTVRIVLLFCFVCLLQWPVGIGVRHASPNSCLLWPSSCRRWVWLAGWLVGWSDPFFILGYLFVCGDGNRNSDRNLFVGSPFG